jgi:hypothetical protein
MKWVLFVLLCVLILTHEEHKLLRELKVRYKKIIEVLRATNDPLWYPVLRPSILTGMVDWSKKNGPIGSNVNKGYEIYICLAGDDVNSATYVLMHELAHMTVPEYGHTDDFWNNLKKLKDICVEAGLYTPEKTHQYCGDTLTDSSRQ